MCMAKRINKSIRALWGTSELGFSFMATMQTSFFIVFLTDAAQLPLAMVGAIAGFTGIADAVSAIIAGAVIDKAHLKGGKYRPWLIICPPLVMIFFILQFTHIGPDVVAAALCSIGYVMGNFIWNIAWTANRAMIGVLTDDPNERGFLSGRIGAGSAGGKIIASYGVPALSTLFIGLFATMGPVFGYAVTAAIASASYLLCYLVHYVITKGYDIPEEAEDGKVKKSASLVDIIKTIFTNPQLLIVVVADSLRLVGFYGFAAAAAYYARIVMGDPGAVSIILIIFNGGTFLGSLMSGIVVKRLGTKMTTIAFTGVAGLLFLFLYLVPLPAMVFYVVLALAEVIFGIAYGLTSSLYSMCGTLSEYEKGVDIKGMAMAGSSLAIKVAVAVRGVILAGMLSSIGYTADAVITAEMQGGINMIVFLVPAAFTLASALAFLLYRIKDADVVAMEQEIAQRKANL